MWARLVRALLESLQRVGFAAPHSGLGSQGETVAYWYLRERGFTMVARNYRRPGSAGEVDLIGWDHGTLVFVEVKTRESDEFRRAEDAVDREKRRHLIAAARDYRQRAQVRGSYRFDVISIHVPHGRRPEIEHFRNAFAEADMLLD